MPEMLTGYAAEVIEGYRNEVSRLLAMLETAKAEATACERQRIREIIAYHRDAHSGNECLPADLLDGDGDD